MKKSKLVFLINSWFVCGVVVTIAGLVGLLYRPLSVILLLPLVSLILISRTLFGSLRQLVISKSWSEIVLVAGLIFIWLIHFTGVWVPETGFDAVWYHLPIVDQLSELHRIVYLPEYYQSVNPLFSDLIFLLGYQLSGELGAKLIAYSLALSLIVVSYGLSRQYVNRFWALLFVIQVSLIQVVTWQASSFYIDVAKAMWELAALYLLVGVSQSSVVTQRNLVQSALFFGAALATKQFTLLLWPVMWLIVYGRGRRLRLVGQWLVVSLLVPLPFYLHSWLTTGDFFYAITLHLAKLSEIGGSPSVVNYLVSRLISLPFAPGYLIFRARDYVSPLLLLLLPLVGGYLRRQWQGKNKNEAFWGSLLLFSLGQFLLWWLVPPVSTRYALSGFIVILLLLFIVTARWLEKNSKWHWPVVSGILLVSVFLLLPRLYVLKRNFGYLIGQQAKVNYLQQFMDGNIDQHLRSWHQLK